MNKSYNAINRLEELQKENIELKLENNELKKENSKLKNYISKTFEAVKYLFDFPMDTFKKLVNSFVQYFEK